MEPAPSEPVVLIGTAHVVNLEASLRSVLSARALDGIALELDAERARALFAPQDRPRGRGRLPVLFRLWAMVQRRLGSEIGRGDPGEEMRVAARVAEERKLPVFLVDDPVRVTFANLVRALPFHERVRLLLGAVAGLFVPSRVVEEEMGRYAERPEEFAEELRKVSPMLAHVLIDVRNEHMAERIKTLREGGCRRLAVVVGDAHLPGLGVALHARGIAVEPVPFRALWGATAPSSSSA